MSTYSQLKGGGVSHQGFALRRPTNALFSVVAAGFMRCWFPVLVCWPTTVIGSLGILSKWHRIEPQSRHPLTPAHPHSGKKRYFTSHPFPAIGCRFTPGKPYGSVTYIDGLLFYHIFLRVSKLGWTGEQVIHNVDLSLPWRVSIFALISSNKAMLPFSSQA